MPRADCVTAMFDCVPGLLADVDGDTRNVVLTGARVWSTLVTGESRPKDAAADWALARLPEAHRLVLERARAIYVGDEEEHWDDLRARVRPHVEHVVAEIEKTRGR